VESSFDKHLATRRRIAIWSGAQKAADIDWVTASDPLQTYNCFGFALGYLQWWEPPVFIDGVCANPETVWPSNSESIDIDAYIAAARTEGFVESPDAAWEQGFETIMLYFTEKNREFQHAARLVSPGIWTSKMGSGSDIMHSIDGVDSIRFGTGRVYMKRAWPYPRSSARSI
jgi:hypothetical protein